MFSYGQKIKNKQNAKKKKKKNLGDMQPSWRKTDVPCVFHKTELDDICSIFSSYDSSEVITGTTSYPHPQW
jgi:hypothetical protein